MQRYKKNSKGMSLVELLIVTGILGFVSLVVASSFSDIFRWQGQVTVKDEANEFSASLARAFFSDAACSEMLKGQVFPVAANTTPAEISIAPFVGSGMKGKRIGKEDSATVSPTISPFLQIKSLGFINKGMAPKPISLEGVIYNHYIAQISLSLDTKDRGKWKTIPPRTFEIPIITDVKTGVIKRCYVEMMIDDACAVMGSTFNPTTGKCIPATQCFFEGSYTKTSCSPAPKSCPGNTVNAQTGGLSCPGGVAGSMTGYHVWSYDEVSEKKDDEEQTTKKITATSEFYICMRCSGEG